MSDQNFVLHEHNARRSQTRVFWEIPLSSKRHAQTFRPIVLIRTTTSTTHASSRSVSLTQFPQDSGCLATDYSLRIAAGGERERRVEDRKDGMFRVFCLKWGCCIYSFLSFPLFFLFFLSSSGLFNSHAPYHQGTRRK